MANFNFQKSALTIAFSAALLSMSVANLASGPALGANDSITVTAQMARTTGTVGPGVFTHSIPLNVWYK